MPYRPLAILSGLTIGDYLLWNWSLNGSHDVLSLVSGLTLPPLVIACLWLLALTVGRLLGRISRRTSPARTRKRTGTRQPAVKPRRAGAAPQPAPAPRPAAASASSSARASRKIAA